MPEQANAPQGSNQPNNSIDWNMQVPVTVDGQQQTLTLNDLRNGYAAQSKVTQATQEAAELRKRLDGFESFMTNLRTDPQGTIEYLQNRYIPEGTIPDDDSNESGAEVDPATKAVQELKQEWARFQEQQAQQAQTNQFRTELEKLKAQHGDAFNETEILKFATTEGIDNLTNAFDLWRYRNPQEKPQGSELPGPLQSQQLGRIARGHNGAPGSEGNGEVPVARNPMDAIRQGFAADGIDLDQLLPN